MSHQTCALWGIWSCWGSTREGKSKVNLVPKLFGLSGPQRQSAEWWIPWASSPGTSAEEPEQWCHACGPVTLSWSSTGRTAEGRGIPQLSVCSEGEQTGRKAWHSPQDTSLPVRTHALARELRKNEWKAQRLTPAGLWSAWWALLAVEGCGGWPMWSPQCRGWAVAGEGPSGSTGEAVQAHLHFLYSFGDRSKWWFTAVYLTIQWIN